MGLKLLKSFTLKWWQTGLFKWSLIALGIIVGSTWPDLFNAWRAPLLILFIVPCMYIFWVWWKQ